MCQDILTDLCAAESEMIHIPGIQKASAHMGMLRAAEFVQRCLLGVDKDGHKTEKEGLLEKAKKMIGQDKVRNKDLPPR